MGPHEGRPSGTSRRSPETNSKRSLGCILIAPHLAPETLWACIGPLGDCSCLRSRVSAIRSSDCSLLSSVGHEMGKHFIWGCVHWVREYRVKSTSGLVWTKLQPPTLSSSSMTTYPSHKHPRSPTHLMPRDLSSLPIESFCRPSGVGEESRDLPVATQP